jgi:hypothetical protein
MRALIGLSVVLALSACGSTTGGGAAGSPADAAADASAADTLAPTQTDAGGSPDQAGPGDGPLTDGAFPDLPADTAADVTPPSPDTATTFPARLYDGIWKVGWLGNYHHYSWIRFIPDASGMAGAFATAPVKCRSCASYFRRPLPDGCVAGDGAFTIGAAGQVTVTLPMACGGEIERWTISDFMAGGRRPEVIETARVRAEVGGIITDGEKYPLSSCNADLTMCPDPYKPL